MQKDLITEIQFYPPVRDIRSKQIAYEYHVAVSDILAHNNFKARDIGGPYTLNLHTSDNRLTFEILNAQDERESPQKVETPISILPFKSMIKDYFLICDSYYEAVQNKRPPDQLQTIDMARRSIHNEGAQKLSEMMQQNGVECDFGTARRLFTLICILNLRYL